MPEIQLPTAAKQDEILQNITTSTYNTEVYNDIIAASFNKNQTNNYTTLLEVNGSGELLELSLGPCDMQNCGIKITIDDEVILARESTWCFALFLLIGNIFNFLESASGTNYLTYSSISATTMKVSIQSTAVASGANIRFMQKPIKFRKCLKVEAFNSQSTNMNSAFTEIGKNRILYRLT